jgi:uncharacterized protein
MVGMIAWGSPGEYPGFLPKSPRVYCAVKEATSQAAECALYPSAPGEPAAPTTLVLDTNVLLDALVFDDSRVQPWLSALRAGRIQAVATPEMRAEWADVIRRPLDARWEPARERVLTSTDEAWLRVVPAPTALPSSAAVIRCRDPDDQKFIDLALALPTRWLLTRDRALLDLAGAARRAGLQVLRPEDSSPET